MRAPAKENPWDQPWLRSLDTYEPGLPMEEVARRLGLASTEEIIKLASNENALGPSPRAVEAMKNWAARMHLYPDGSAYYLRHALARTLNVAADEILIGNGSNELIVLLSHVLLEPGTSIVMADRAFLVYDLVARAYRAHTIRVPMRAFTHDLAAMQKAVRPDTRIVYVSNPNNPTGTMVGQEEIEGFLEALPEHVVAVFDEAYLELVPPERRPDTIRYVRAGRRVCVLRTFSKTYGLAGLRIGYGVGPKALIAALNRVRQPFNVNAMAQAAALAALDDETHVERTRRMVEEGLAYLEQAFEESGLEYVPSVANFILVKVGDGRRVCEALLRRRIIVRPMDAYELPEYVRVTVGTREQNEALVRALNEVLRENRARVV